MSDLPRDAQHDDAVDPLDVALAVVAVALATTDAVRRAVRRRLAPVERLVLQPSFLPERARPGTWLSAGLRSAAARGRTRRERLGSRFDALVPVAVDAAMRRVRPTEVIRRHVDLDELVARLAVDAVVARAARDAVAARVDVDAVAARVDVQAVADRIDLDEAARRLDIEAVLDRLDLTETVLQRVDLAAVASAVLTQVDVPTVVEGILDEIDLPEIIRESTGSMASDTVRGVRMQGVSADETVSRVVDRLLLRRGRPAPGGPG